LHCNLEGVAVVDLKWAIFPLELVQNQLVVLLIRLVRISEATRINLFSGIFNTAFFRFLVLNLPE
jgi:hypothetical protein